MIKIILVAYMLMFNIFIGCINAADKADYENIKVIEGSKNLIINFSDRLQGVYYKPEIYTGLTIITDKQTGREYMYYDKTVIELKPKGECNGTGK